MKHIETRSECDKKNRTIKAEWRGGFCYYCSHSFFFFLSHASFVFCLLTIRHTICFPFSSSAFVLFTFIFST